MDFHPKPHNHERDAIVYDGDARFWASEVEADNTEEAAILEDYNLRVNIVHDDLGVVCVCPSWAIAGRILAILNGYTYVAQIMDKLKTDHPLEGTA